MSLKIPDRTMVFLAAFWFWTWVLFQFNRLTQVILHSILAWAPDKYIPSIPEGMKKSPVKLLRAADKEGRSITNKLNLFLNLKWDHETENAEGELSGGVDIREFAKCIGTTVVWAAYLLEYELDPAYNEFIATTRSRDFTSIDFRKLFKAVFIDVSNKIIYRFGAEDTEPLMFGETTF